MSLPMIIALGAAILAVAVAIPILMRRSPSAKTAEFFQFDRERNVINGKGENLADLVIIPRGGYVIRPQSTFLIRHGRALFEAGNVEWRRRSKPATLSLAGMSAGIQVQQNGKTYIEPLTRTEFDQRERTAAEIAVSEAAQRAGAAGFVAKLLGATAVLLALPVLGIVAALALR